MHMQIEYGAASRGAHAEVLADLAAIKEANRRGEFIGRCVRVVREADGRRRVVPTPDAEKRFAAAASRRAPAAPRPPQPPQRPPQPVDPSRPAAAFPFPMLVEPVSRDEMRRRRLRQVELDLESDRLRSRVDRAQRLRGAEDAMYGDAVARLGGPILRSARALGASR